MICAHGDRTTQDSCVLQIPLDFAARRCIVVSMKNTTTQKQRDFITSLLNQIGVEKAYTAGAINHDQALDQSAVAGRAYRVPREVARHTHSVKLASETINALLKLR